LVLSYLAEYASNSLLREGLSIDAIPNLVSWKTGLVSTSINNAACEKGSNFEWDIPEIRSMAIFYSAVSTCCCKPFSAISLSATSILP